MYKIENTPQSEEDLKKLKRSEPQAFKKATKLLHELMEHPYTGTGQSRQYVRLHEGKAMSAEQVAAEIQEASSVTTGDVKAVMSAMCQTAIRELSNGRRFYLPEIGYLSLSVGLALPEGKPAGKATGRDISVRNINFKPERKFLRRVAGAATFAKSARSTRSAAYTDDALWAKVSAYIAANRLVTRQAMRREFGLSEHMAKRWLDRFVADGRLKHERIKRQHFYYQA